MTTHTRQFRGRTKSCPRPWRMSKQRGLKRLSLLPPLTSSGSPGTIPFGQSAATGKCPLSFTFPSNSQAFTLNEIPFALRLVDQLRSWLRTFCHFSSSMERITCPVTITAKLEFNLSIPQVVFVHCHRSLSRYFPLNPSLSLSLSS